MSTFKELYSDQWQAGNTRERYVRSLLELVGYDVEDFGFMTESVGYNPAFNQEPGKPDFLVKTRSHDNGVIVHVCYVEVTGTRKLREKTVWVRPDKVQWARMNPMPSSYLAFIQDQDAGRILWIKLRHVSAWPIIQVQLGKGLEHYHEVPLRQLLSTRKFLIELRNPKQVESESVENRS